MKVRELIAILEGLDPSADVYVMSQRSWPFECEAAGVAVREDLAECDDDGEKGEPPLDRWTARESDLPGSDVFILEGSQLRYGNRAAWEARR